MNEFRADLHCHSTCSDGTKTPEELIELAMSIGLKGLSITDHDTIAAYRTALPYLHGKELKLLAGAEFSAMYKGTSVHILAYSFNLHNENLHAFCQKHTQRRLERNRLILEKLAKENIPITEEEILNFSPQKKTLGRPHIAYAMLKKGYVESIQEAFSKYLKEGASCYTSGNAFSIEETLEIIHQAKGLAFLAHPHLLHAGQKIHQILQMKFDGIECYYGKFFADEHTRWLKIARKKNLLISGGSDFHGEFKPNIPLGCSWVSEELFRPLYNLFLQNQTP